MNKKYIVEIVAVAVLIIGAVLYITDPDVSEPQVADDQAMPARITVTGTQTCLPHKDKTGPQTLECATGFQGDDGEYYGIDMMLLSSTDTIDMINSGARVTIEGVFVPTIALSTDFWQKYDMKGIISVTSARPE